MNLEKKITILVASDNHYAILIAALLKSIDLNHKSDEFIDFHVIDDEISKSIKSRLESIVDPSRLSITWHNSKYLIPLNLSLPIDTSAFPLTTYFRIFTPNILNADIEKVIYLDVDTILQEDISKLWNISLEGYTLGAVLDLGKTMDCKWGGVPNYKELGLEPNTKYFNAGVLLIDLNQWRKQNISEKIVDALRVHKDYVQMADQYGFNVVFANQWLELDPKWNWYATGEDVKPYLIHFLDIKPIFKSYVSNEVYKKTFFQYLEQTPWKNFKPISGIRRTMRKAMNKAKKLYLRFISKNFNQNLNFYKSVKLDRIKI